MFENPVVVTRWSWGGYLGQLFVALIATYLSSTASWPIVMTIAQTIAPILQVPMLIAAPASALFGLGYFIRRTRPESGREGRLVWLVPMGLFSLLMGMTFATSTFLSVSELFEPLALLLITIPVLSCGAYSLGVIAASRLGG